MPNLKPPSLKKLAANLESLRSPPPKKTSPAPRRKRPAALTPASLYHLLLQGARDAVELDRKTRHLFRLPAVLALFPDMTPTQSVALRRVVRLEIKRLLRESPLCRRRASKTPGLKRAARVRAAR